MRNNLIKCCTLVSLLFFLTFPTFFLFSSDKIEYTIKEGYDWNLPKNVIPSQNAGAAFYGEIPNKPYVKLVVVMVSWASMNPHDGEYDFSKLNKYLKTAKEHNLQLILRLTCHATSRKSTYSKKSDEELPYIPQWVLNKHNPKEFLTYKGSAPGKYDNKGNFYIKVAAPWNQGVQAELKKFIFEFSKQSFFNDTALRGLYIHGFSSSYGEEFWLHKNHTKYALNAGMTEEKIIKTYKDRIDWWVKSAGKNINKLIWIHIASSN